MYHIHVLSLCKVVCVVLGVWCWKSERRSYTRYAQERWLYPTEYNMLLVKSMEAPA